MSPPVDAVRAVEVILKLGAVMLAAGSPTDDVERAMRAAAASLGLERTTAAVSFGMISLTYFPGMAAQPITAILLVSEQTTDYRRLAAASELVARLRAETVDLESAAAEVDRIGSLETAWPEPFTSLAQALSAAASTVLFGGSAADALATLIIGVMVQPIVVRLDGSGLPPFFRSLIGPLVSSLLVAVTVAIGAPISPALVLTGSLLRFLPGASLVAGMRDLIDQSTISGAARLANALLIGAAVASGTAIGIGLAAQFGVHLEIAIPETGALQGAVQVVAAAIACGAWAVRLGEPRFALLTASALGALGWAIYLSFVPIGGLGATIIAGLTVGAFGRLLARRRDAPIVLWVVPASLPLLPGLLIVTGMLSADAVAGLLAMTAAVATGLAVGGSIAFGDIVVQTVRQVRKEIIEPVIVQPVADVLTTGLRAVRPQASRDRTDEEEREGP
jgi:uncharacterized membrane protein YjjP (DUF1212 family)/uncharacterized membrane protein YjjB (DUF3815 family)